MEGTVRRTVKIGIDFGTTYSFAAFLHGNEVVPLIPVSERYGMPSIFYYDGQQKLIGRMAERQAQRKPECAVYSVKRKLADSFFMLAGKKFTPEDIVRELLEGVVAGAEAQLETEYLEDYDEIEAVIAVPVAFSEPLRSFIKTAAEKVKLRNGRNLRVTGLLTEPVAASVAYFGIKKETDANILVYDLGGGTFDAALVRARGENEEIPYEVIDQEGDERLGGDDWDRMLAKWISRQYESRTGEKIGSRTEALFRREAREIKEELTREERVITSVAVKKEDLDLELTREEFDRLTRSLAERTLDKIRILLKRNSALRIDHVILTGGGSRMPQISRLLRESGLFSPGTDIRLVSPEHAIAFGAARHAASLDWNYIILRAAQSYGCIYRVAGREGKEMLEIQIRKGAVLPAVCKTVSHTGRENQKRSLLRVLESDYDGDERYVEVSQGREIMRAELLRDDEYVEIGRETRDILTLTRDGILTVRSVDRKSGKETENSVKIDRYIAGRE